MPASDLVIVTCRDRFALDAVRTAVESWTDAALVRVDDAVLSLAVEPRTVGAEVLRARLAALEGVDAAYVKPPDALP